MRVKVNQSTTIKARVDQSSNNQVVAVGIQGPPGVNLVSSASDVSVVDLQDGSVLVYSTAISKWEATNRLQKQELEGGQF